MRLIVEVDGGYHHARAQLEARRDAELARAGYGVIRVQAAHLGEAVVLIRAALSAAP